MVQGGRRDRASAWGPDALLRPLNFIPLNRANSCQVRRLMNFRDPLLAGILAPPKSTPPNAPPPALRNADWREVSWELRLPGKCGGGMVLGHLLTAASKAAGKPVQNKVKHYGNHLCCSVAREFTVNERNFLGSHIFPLSLKVKP